MSNEKSFQSYLLSVAKGMNFHRTALTSGAGFPDITAFHGDKHSLIELKDLVLGKRGDKKIGPMFKDSQPAWYVRYFQEGGSRLFVAFRITDHDGSNKRYGLWQLTKKDVLALDTIYYKDLLNYPLYKEFGACKEMVGEIQYWSAAR